MESQIIFKLLVIFAAFGGFLIAFYVQHTKKKDEPMVCPLGHSCDEVVHSQYSKFLGFEMTAWGMLYYLFVAVFYATLLVFGANTAPVLAFFALAISMVAVLFSLYLLAIQAFVLKNWCTWCIFSAIISIAILVFAILGVELDLPAFLAFYKPLIILIHALSAAVGVGAVTVTDVLFFKFLKDYRISKGENTIMKALSQVIWVALAIGLLTGIGLYIPNAEVLNTTPKFLVKALLVLGLVLNGLLLNIIITPKLEDIDFDKENLPHPGHLNQVRALAFASGAFSIVTWYAVFLLGSIRNWPYTFGQIFGAYLIIIGLAVLASQIVRRMLSKGKITFK